MLDLRSGLVEGRSGLGDDIGTVDKITGIMSDNSHLSHRCLEVAPHQLLVVHHDLPFTSSALQNEREVSA